MQRDRWMGNPLSALCQCISPDLHEKHEWQEVQAVLQFCTAGSQLLPHARGLKDFLPVSPSHEVKDVVEVPLYFLCTSRSYTSLEGDLAEGLSAHGARTQRCSSPRAAMPDGASSQFSSPARVCCTLRQYLCSGDNLSFSLFDFMDS